MGPADTRHALIVGSTGIVGNSLAAHLLDRGWAVTGLARKAVADPAGVVPVRADLLQPDALRRALADVRPTHVFLSTWLRHDTEAENIRVNSAMVRHLLDAVRPAGTVRHVALVTGLKHYLGPFEAYGQGPRCPRRPSARSRGRVPYVANFYYEQEDELFAQPPSVQGFTWSGAPSAHDRSAGPSATSMNMGVTLAVYGSSLPQATGAGRSSVPRLAAAVQRRH